MQENKKIVFEGYSRRLDIFAADELADFSRAIVQKMIKDGKITVNGKRVKPSWPLTPGEVVEIERGDVEIITSEMPGWAVVTDGNLTVALDLTVTPERKNEGVSREIVKRIQNHRKESGFEITDRIRVTLSNHPEIEEAVNSFHDYIAAQVLADELRCAEIPAGTDGAVTFDFGDFTIEAVIER